MDSISKLFCKTIRKNYKLKRRNKDWLCQNGELIKLRSPGNKSFGFSLDNSTKPLFCFISSNPPQHINKMCDAIICLSYKDKDYLFIIEKKTGNKYNYELQLINGKLFCDWILTLFKQHNHYTDTKSINYIALLVWKPREVPNRGTTAHNQDRSGTPQSLAGHFNRFEEIKNQSEIYLKDYL